MPHRAVALRGRPDPALIERLAALRTELELPAGFPPEVLEEADAAAFPRALEKRGVLSAPLVTAALDWLAGFHGYFWGRRDGDGDGGRRRPILDDDWASLVRPPLQQQ